MQNFSFAQRAWLAFFVLAILNLLTAAAATLGLGSGMVWMVAVAGAVAAVVGGGWWVGQAGMSLAKVEKALRHIAEGDFRYQAQLDSADEFADLIKSVRTLAQQLHSMISDVLGNARHIAEQSLQLDKAADKLVAQTGQQRDQAHQVTQASEQMSQSGDEIQRATEETAESARQATQVVREGEANMQASRQSTTRIVEVVGDARATLDDLNHAVARIGSMTGTIKEIADQTNLLALNAAIEAARAGESGRGFAVVADEVRKLAERTSQSTLDINNNVANIQLVTQATLMAMEDAVSEVSNGNVSIEASSRNLQEVAAAASHTMSMTGKISDSLRQQSSIADGVARTIAQMASSIDANHREAQGLAESAEQLAQTASALRSLVARYEKSL